MRNVVEHPITNEEIKRYLQGLQSELTKKYDNDPDPPVGDMDGVILEEVIERITSTEKILRNHLSGPIEKMIELQRLYNIKELYHGLI